MFAQRIGRAGTENLLSVVEHGRAEQRCERRGGRRLLLFRQEGAEIGEEWGKLVLNVFRVQFGGVE